MEMNPAGNVSPQRGVAKDQSTASDGRYLRTGLWVLIVAAFCCVALWRFGREWSTSRDPMANAIDALSASSPSDRIAAIRQVSQLGMANLGRAIPPMLTALKDTDAGVRVQAAEAIALLGSYSVYNHAQDGQPAGGDDASVGTLTSALLTALAKDDEPSVRAAAAGALRNICATEPMGTKTAKRSKKRLAADSSGAATAGPSPVEYKTILDALVVALGDPDAKVRSVATAALARPVPSSPPNRWNRSSPRSRTSPPRSARRRSPPSRAFRAAWTALFHP